MGWYRHARLGCAGIATTVVAVIFALACAPARASESLYWNWAALNADGVTSSGIAAASLGGSGGQDLSLDNAPIDHPLGVVVDSATGTLYWANFGSSRNYCEGPLVGGQTISFASPTGGGTLNTSGATVSGPDGLAIDPVAGRLYWANDHANSISYTNLDGSGGHDLNTAGATLNCPAGLAVDPQAGRVYWTNLDGDSISYANLDGSGGHDLQIQGATVDGPWGIAIDQAAGRIYWANFDANTIDYANLDGSGAGVLNTYGTSVLGPWGIALDPAAGKVYWGNDLGHSLSYANLDGSGGGDVPASGATTDHPKAPMLVQSPSAVAAPQVSGGSTAGSRLSCSPGGWAADLPESFLFRAPSWFTYAWTENGRPIAGSSSSIVAASPGRYACQVTATNFAGSATQSSTPLDVHPGAGASLSVASVRVSRSGVIAVWANANGAGSLTGRVTFRHTSRIVPYGAASTSGAGALRLTIKPSPRARRLLSSTRRAMLTLSLVFTSVDGSVAQATTPVWFTRRAAGR